MGGLLLKVVNGTGMWLRGQNYNARSFSRVSSAMVAWCTVRKAVHLRTSTYFGGSLGFSSNLERRIDQENHTTFTMADLLDMGGVEAEAPAVRFPF